MRLSKILGFADNDIGKLAKLYLNEFSTIKELKENITAIFAEKISSKDFEKEFHNIKNCLQKAPFFEDFEKLEKYVEQETNLKDKDLSKPLRYVLTGTYDGPNISDIYPLIKNYLGEIVR